MSQPEVRKGMPSRRLDRGTFEKRFKLAVCGSRFAPLQHELQAITDAAWDVGSDTIAPRFWCVPAAWFGEEDEKRRPSGSASSLARNL